MNKLLMASLIFSVVGVGCLRAMEEVDQKDEVFTKREIELFGEYGEGYNAWEEQESREKAGYLKKFGQRAWLVAAERIPHDKLVGFTLCLAGYLAKEKEGHWVSFEFEKGRKYYNEYGKNVVMSQRYYVLRLVLDITDDEFATDFRDYPNKQTLEQEKKELMSEGVHLDLKDVANPDTNTLVGYLLHKVKNRKKGGGWLFQKIAERNKEKEENKLDEQNERQDEQNERQEEEDKGEEEEDACFKALLRLFFRCWLSR